MLISRERKLLFVHIQKTGGSSISEFLKKNIPDVQLLLAKHEFAARGRASLPEWDEYFRFAFVRNPWDRMVSWYTMIASAGSLSQQEAAASGRKMAHFQQWRSNKLWLYAMEEGPTFADFIRRCSEPVEVEKGVHYSFAYNQLDYLADAGGKLLVDFVGRHERWEADSRQLLDRLGFTGATLPHVNRSEHRHYSTYYDPDTAAVVARRFRRDIEFFGYEFQPA